MTTMQPNLALAYSATRKPPLQRLTTRHRTMIALHLASKDGAYIAKYIGCSVGTVYRVLNDPASRTVIDHYLQGVEGDLAALLPKAVSAIREGLEHGDTKIKLKAVDRFAKMTSRGGDSGNGVDVTVNLINTRDRFIAELKDLSTVVDSEALEVSDDN